MEFQRFFRFEMCPAKMLLDKNRKILINSKAIKPHGMLLMALTLLVTSTKA